MVVNLYKLTDGFLQVKKCCICGEINHGLGREEREWECPHCHSLLSRDLNAAINILVEGLRAVGSPVLSLVDFMHIFPTEFLNKLLNSCDINKNIICMA